jgi:hypothetical protein
MPFVVQVHPELLPHEFRRLDGWTWQVSRALADRFSRTTGVGSGQDAFAVSTDPSLLLQLLADMIRGREGRRRTSGSSVG